MVSPGRLVLGIDPGSIALGWGVVAARGNSCRHVASGVIRPKAKAFNDRLLEIGSEIEEILRAHRPSEAAVETAFFHEKVSVQSALKLGHVRGVVILLCRRGGVPVSEYAPAEIKRAIAGKGRAEKFQVARMVQIVLGLSAPPPADAADALAVALTHLQRGTLPSLAGSIRGR
ncbi:MAG: crossover junction endodeoxyribonuclease RuvC [Bdellovibrionota bacterium]